MVLLIIVSPKLINTSFSVTGSTEMLMRNAAIVHYALFWNGNNGFIDYL